MRYRNFILALFSILCTSLLTAQGTSSITINTKKIIKPVQVKFGTGVGSLHRGPGWPPVDLNNPALLELFNEVSPAFINLQYTMSPTSVEHIIGLPFYPEGTGSFSQRLSYIDIIERMGIDSSSTGAEGDLYALFTSEDTIPDAPSIINGVPYYTYVELCSRPPHHNYDDLLQFFESMEEPPEIFIRVPTIFMTYIDDPFPHSGDIRAEITIDLDPKTGADMVHYFNDPISTELGSLRAQNGHPEPYNIKYFMLGNEIWWPQVDYGLSIGQVVNQTIAFAEAMKAADSTITIVFNPVNDAFPDSFLNTSDSVYGPYIQQLKNFNEEVIPQIKDHIDAVEFFQYGLAVGDGTELPPLDNDGWKSSMALNHILHTYDNTGFHRNIADEFDIGTPMIMGEFSGPSARLGGAIYDADYMIYLLNNEYDIFVANWNSGLIESNYFGLIKQDVFNEEPPVKRPNFYTLKLFTNYFGNTIVESVVTNPPLFDVVSFNTGAFLTFPAAQDVPALNCIATVGDDKLYLMTINRDLDNDIQTQVVLNGFSPTGNAQVYTLNGPSIDATNEDIQENVTITESTIDNISDTFSFSFEKHSVTVMVFEGLTTVAEEDANQFRLLQNYPNPFSSTTTITYEIPHSSYVSLTIYHIFGKEVTMLVQTRQAAGRHEEYWNGENDKGQSVGSGIYIIRLQAGESVDSKKILLVK